MEGLQWPPSRLVDGESEVGQIDQRVQGDLGLGPREGCAEAVVGAASERHVATSVAGDVEHVG